MPIGLTNLQHLAEYLPYNSRPISANRIWRISKLKWSDTQGNWSNGRSMLQSCTHAGIQIMVFFYPCRELIKGRIIRTHMSFASDDHDIPAAHIKMESDPGV